MKTSLTFDIHDHAVPIDDPRAFKTVEIEIDDKTGHLISEIIYLKPKKEYAGFDPGARVAPETT